jgi:SAM-dependent methyltransferase
MNHAHTHTPHPDASHGHHHEHGTDGQAEILDLDAEVLAEHTASITAWLPLQTDPHHIVDLGCGTGAGTFALLDRFPDAHVTAVDASAEHLQRLRTKACALGAQERVHTVQADLDEAAWPDLGSPDLVWASASMHHMAHPDRALRTVHDTLAPGGLFTLVELAGHPRFLPENAPEDRPGLEERVHAAADRRQAEHLPHRGADWGPMLTAAGFAVEGERTVRVYLEGAVGAVGADGADGPAVGAVGRFALGGLRRLREAVGAELPAEDLRALDGLLDTGGPSSVLRRGDLAVRTEHAVWAARRA